MRMRAARSSQLVDPARRALLLLAATTVLLIAGLLGMHSLSGTGSSHAAGLEHGGAVLAVGDASPASHGSHDAPLAHGSHDAPLALGSHDASASPGSHSAAAHCDDGCAAAAPGHVPDSPGHAGIAACVLALLAGLILLLPPASSARAGASMIVRWPATAATAARPSAPPPSLTLLSISRT